LGRVIISWPSRQFVSTERFKFFIAEASRDLQRLRNALGKCSPPRLHFGKQSRDPRRRITLVNQRFRADAILN
jgi:hypothetical protein